MVADQEIAAAARLRAMCPGAVNVLMERGGYRALHSFGAGSTPLMGMAMLDSHSRNIEVVSGGSVVIEVRA